MAKFKHLNEVPIVRPETTTPLTTSRPAAIEFADVAEAVGMEGLIGGAETTLEKEVFIKEINNRIALLETAIYKYCPDTSWRRDALRDLYNSATAARFAIRNPDKK
jgi:hypothetical protein